MVVQPSLTPILQGYISDEGDFIINDLPSASYTLEVGNLVSHAFFCQRQLQLF